MTTAIELVPQVAHHTDPENATSTGIYTPDPLNLRARLVEADYLAKASKVFSFTREKKQYRELQQFYESQNEHIGNLLKPMDQHTMEANDAADKNRLKVQIAVWGSSATLVTLWDAF